MMLDGKTGAEWSNFWSGRSCSEGGDAYVGAGVERDADLTGFWERRLIVRPVESRCLDLACGSGAVVRHAVRIGFYDVFGLDVSQSAIVLLRELCPDAIGLVGSAHQIPFPERSVDIITSQFGFEYAGVRDTLPEICRLLRPSGLFLALVHMRDGVIARSCHKEKADAEIFAQSGFTEAACAVFSAAAALTGNAASRSAYDSAVAAMRPTQMILSEMAQNGHQLARHTLAGTGELFQRRQNYALEDITGWLEGIALENKAHIRRMEAMLAAALTEDEALAALNGLKASGLETEALQPLRIGPQRDPVGWIFAAVKPA